MAILDMVEKNRKAWENGEQCFGVFTVDHSILIGKLEHLGIRGLPLELIKSYLSNRRQFVAFGQAESPQQGLSVGDLE